MATERTTDNLPRILVIDDEKSIGQTGHIFDAGKVLFEFFTFAFVTGDFFFRKEIVLSATSHGFDFPEPLYAFLNSCKIGKEPAQPSLIDVIHGRALRRFLNSFLRLALRAQKKNRFALDA